MSIQVGAKKVSGSKNSTVVTKEDQDKINRFARLNTRHVDLAADIADKERELENYQEAITAVEELELTADEGTSGVPYRVGDVFFNVDFSEASSRLEASKEKLTKDKSDKLEEKASLDTEMGQLKSELYSKFGDQINLDPDVD